jgi:aspartate racemase
MHTPCLADYVACLDRGDLEAVGDLMLASAHNTKWLVESDVYPEKLAARGLDHQRPSTVEREEINRIIMDELVKGTFKPEAVATLQQTIERLKQAGCDAVILGCTEIPLIIDDTNSPLPTLDSTRLLARAALHRAVHSG